MFCLDTKNTINFFRSGKDLNPVVELFFGESNVEGVYEGEFICVTWVCSYVEWLLLTDWARGARWDILMVRGGGITRGPNKKDRGPVFTCTAKASQIYR